MVFSALSFFKRAPLWLPCLTKVIFCSLLFTTFKFMNSHVIFLTRKTFLIRTFEPCLQMPCTAILLAHCHEFLKTELASEFTPWMGNEDWIFHFGLCLHISTKCCLVLEFHLSLRRDWFRWLHQQRSVWVP